MWHFTELLALAVMNNRLCWGLSKKNNSLCFQTHFQATCGCTSCFFATDKRWCNVFFPPLKKVFRSFSLTSVAWIKMQALQCLFSPPRPQSAIYPFDLLFIWLSPCTSRLFILHFNIWWGHLWSGECSSWVTSVDKNVFLSAVPLIIFKISAVFFLSVIKCTF